MVLLSQYSHEVTWETAYKLLRKPSHYLKIFAMFPCSGAVVIKAGKAGKTTVLPGYCGI